MEPNSPKGRTIQSAELELEYERRADGIYVYHFKALTRNAIDTWVDLVIANDRAAAQAGEHACSLYILHRLLPTPYLIRRGFHVATRTPQNLVESIAVLTQPGLPQRLLRVAANRMPARQRMAIRIFTVQDAAIDWLHHRRQILNAEV